jgi:hypothetical protein
MTHSFPRPGKRAGLAEKCPRPPINANWLINARSWRRVPRGSVGRRRTEGRGRSLGTADNAGSARQARGRRGWRGRGSRGAEGQRKKRRKKKNKARSLLVRMLESESSVEENYWIAASCRDKIARARARAIRPRFAENCAIGIPAGRCGDQGR